MGDLGAFLGPAAASITIAPQTGADAAINAAITSLSAQGGGTVFLSAGTYTIANPITLAQGVWIVGVPPRLNYTTNTAPIPDSNAVIANGGGTVLQASGSTACFQWNKTALGVGTANGFVLTGLNNIVLRNLCMTGFTRAVDGGNTNNAACWYSEFDNLYISNCTDWGFWITNFQHCKFRRIFTFSNTTGGQFYGNDVPSTTLQPGNSVWEDVYSVTPSSNANLSRGIVYWIQQGQQNEGLILRLQSNRLNSSVVTQAATMVNTSANITITDGTKFAVGMPVTFSATANGFFQNEIYFVLSVAVNVIQVALTVGGAAVVATGATAVNCITQGFAALEVVALAGAAVSSHDFHNVDVEAGGTAAIVAQNVQVSKFEISQVPLAAQSTQSFCARNLTFSQVFARASINTSWDGNSGSSQLYGNRATGSVGGGAVAHNPAGLYFDAGDGFTELNLTASVKGLSGQAPDGSNLIVPLSGIGERMNPKATQAISPNCADTGLVSFTFTSGVVTVTLPTLSATLFGCRYIFVNPTANTATINTQASQGFNNPAGRTSVTLAQGTAIELVGTHDANGNYWTVKGIGGVYAAGAITAF